MQRLTEIIWPADYGELKRIEELLSCGICYEYMKTPVMTPCSHNYCSLCIRTYLNFKTQCPKCYINVHDKDLCKNRDLDEIIECFSSLRDKLAICINSSAKQTVRDTERNSIVIAKCEADNTPIKPARTNLNLTTPRTLITEMNNDSHEYSIKTPNNSLKKTPQKCVSSPSTSSSPKVPTMFTPKNKISKLIVAEAKDKMVPCPVCSVSISDLHINKHLDSCLKREKSPPKMTKAKRPMKPKLVCHLMKDKALRAKLKEYNLSTLGDRKALELRLRDYITLYNSECDKEDPRPDSELIKQLEDAENQKKESKAFSTENRLRVSNKASKDEIEKEHKRYLEMNQESFATLIAKIHRKMPKSTDANSSAGTSIPDLEQFEPPDSDSNTSCPLLRYANNSASSYVEIELLDDSDQSKKNNSPTFCNGGKKIPEDDDCKFGVSPNEMLELEYAPSENSNPCNPVRVTPDNVPEIESAARSESNETYLPVKVTADSSSSVSFMGPKEDNTLSDNIFDASTDGGLTDPNNKFDNVVKEKKFVKKRSNQCTDSESDSDEICAPARRKTKKQKQRAKKGMQQARNITNDFLFDLSGSHSSLQSDDEPKADETKKIIALDISTSSCAVPTCSKRNKENMDSPVIECRSSVRRSSRKRSNTSYSKSIEIADETRTVKKFKKLLDNIIENSNCTADDVSGNDLKPKSERGRGRPKRKSEVLEKPVQFPKRALRERTKIRNDN